MPVKPEIIQDWLRYWETARLVSIDQIQSVDHVHIARKFCSCMRTGAFEPELVTDLQIWRALAAMRAAQKAAA